MNVLVTGGAGYIGSHAVRRLIQGGHAVVVLDNLTTGQGHRSAVPDTVPFEQADLHETDRIAELLRARRVDCVMHFAALADVKQSTEQPLRYYHNNVAGTLSLLRAMADAGTARIIFSSTCAVYGQPSSVPITEELPLDPLSPYGRSKAMVETALRDHAAEGFSFAALRYFNVAGAARDGSIGEDHRPESHLIPILLQTAAGRRTGITIFGDDYPTPDGTCIRDYLHVEDLVDAHVAVMEALRPGDRRVYNLGIGRGHSVREVLETARRVTGKEIPAEVGPRRPGDPAQLYSSPEKIRRDLGWQAQTTDLAAIIETAWRWTQEHPTGYYD